MEQVKSSYSSEGKAGFGFRCSNEDVMLFLSAVKSSNSTTAALSHVLTR